MGGGHFIALLFSLDIIQFNYTVRALFILITEVVTTNSHKNRTNNKNKGYIFLLNLERLKHCIINSDKASDEEAFPVLSEELSFLAHHCEILHIPK